MQVAFSADERRTVEQPYYLPSGNEIEVFQAAPARFLDPDRRGANCAHGTGVASASLFRRHDLLAGCPQLVWETLLIGLWITAIFTRPD